MRMSATKVVGALAIGGTLLASTACGPFSTLAGGADKDEACKNIRTELSSVQGKMASPDTTNPGASNAANAQLFRDTASKIRSEGQKAGGDVETSAGKVATDLEGLATTLSNLSSGNTSSPGAGTSSFIQDAAELGRACGFSGT
jgi:ABC-type transport system substrate-binding protein